MKTSKLMIFNVIVLFLVSTSIFAQRDLQNILDTINDGNTIYVNDPGFISDHSYELTNKHNIVLVFNSKSEIFCTSRYEDVFNINECSNITIVNGKFKHKLFQEDMCIGAVFKIVSSANISLLNCDINGSGSIGVYGSKSKELKVTNCFIHDNSSAAFFFNFDCSNIKLLSNTVLNNGPSKDILYADWGGSIDKSLITERQLTEDELNILTSFLKKLDDGNTTKEVAEISQENILQSQTITDNDIKSKSFPAYCINVKDGYSDEVWLIPTVAVSEYYKRISGLISFDPKISYLLTKLSVSDINSITPKAFIAGVQKNELLLAESYTSGISYNLIPELNYKIDLLRTKDILEIAAERDKIIGEILKIREKYIKANLVYKSTKFEVPGLCYADKANYNVNNQQIDLHISINYGESGIYIATARVPLPLSEAQKFFQYYDTFNVFIYYSVSVGNDRKNLGISGGGVPHWIMPNLIILENPIINIKFPNGLNYSFKTNGLKGQLWSPIINTSRWDLNKPERPYQSYNFNTRIITGIKL